MDIVEAKAYIKNCENKLGETRFTHFHTFQRDERSLRVSITARLKKRSKKEGVWLSKEMLITLLNASYGFDEKQSRCVSGRDGIFLLDRDHRPANAMMRKIFEQFIDKQNSGFLEIADELNQTPESLKPVRLVSHHMRLLGVLSIGSSEDQLVLVDCDRTK